MTEQGASVNWPGRLSLHARFDSRPWHYPRPVTELYRSAIPVAPFLLCSQIDSSLSEHGSMATVFSTMSSSLPFNAKRPGGGVSAAHDPSFGLPSSRAGFARTRRFSELAGPFQFHHAFRLSASGLFAASH